MAKEHIAYPKVFNENYLPEDIDNVKLIIDWQNQSTERTNRLLHKIAGKCESYISQLLTGKFPSSPAQIIKSILPTIKDTAIAEPGKFIDTSISKLVIHACDVARRKGCFCVSSGAPGVGKTTAIEHYKELHPSTILIYGGSHMDRLAAVDDIIDQLNLKSAANLKHSKQIKAIWKYLKGSGRLIILDETDKCPKGTTETIRTISDASHCGVVLVGNVKLHEDVKEGDQRYDLIASRCGFWPDIMRHVELDDAVKLMRPVISEDMISDDQTYEEFVKHCREITNGDARKLIEHFADHLIVAHKSFQRKAESSGKRYTGLTRRIASDIAKMAMSVPVTPPIPRKSMAV